MSNRSPERVKRMTDVLDEIIPTIPVDDRSSDLIMHVSRCILKAAEEQTSYMTLLAVASAESGAVSKDPVRARAPLSSKC
jgi:hypothetical protein